MTLSYIMEPNVESLVNKLCSKTTWQGYLSLCELHSVACLAISEQSQAVMTCLGLLNSVFITQCGEKIDRIQTGSPNLSECT